MTMRKGTNERGLRELIEWLPISEITMVEVGSYAGESAAIFAASFKVNKITCVDHWNPNAGWKGTGLSEAESRFDIVKANSRKIGKLKIFSEEGARLFDSGSLDFVYIDASHDYESVKHDIELWRPKIRVGGFIGGHDYSYHFPGVVKAVGEAFQKPEHVFCDASWIVRL